MNKLVLEQIEFSPLSQAVYERILKAITSGRLLPGSPVTIPILAEKLDVSLMPVREAIRKLEAAGLIFRQKNRRIRVNEFSPNELNEILQIRLHLETMAARKAVRNCTDETITNLQRLIREMERAEDIEEFFEKNRRFHHTIYETANMPILQAVINDLWLRVSPYLHIYIAEVPDYKSLATTTHDGMLHGIKKRNAKELCKWLKLDLKNAAKLTINILKKKDFDSRIELLK